MFLEARALRGGGRLGTVRRGGEGRVFHAFFSPNLAVAISLEEETDVGTSLLGPSQFRGRLESSFLFGRGQKGRRFQEGQRVIHAIAVFSMPGKKKASLALCLGGSPFLSVLRGERKGERVGCLGVDSRRQKKGGEKRRPFAGGLFVLPAEPKERKGGRRRSSGRRRSGDGKKKGGTCYRVRWENRRLRPREEKGGESVCQ